MPLAELFTACSWARSASEKKPWEGRRRSFNCFGMRAATLLPERDLACGRLHGFAEGLRDAEETGVERGTGEGAFEVLVLVRPGEGQERLPDFADVVC